MAEFRTLPIPVIVGEGYGQIMCMAIVTSDDTAVTLTVTTLGQDARDLLAAIETTESMALKIVSVPAPPKEKPNE